MAEKLKYAAGAALAGLAAWVYYVLPKVRFVVVVVVAVAVVVIRE